MRDIRATRLAFHGGADDVTRLAAMLGGAASGEDGTAAALAAFGLRLEPEA